MRTRNSNGVAPAASLADKDMLPHLMESFRQRMLSSVELFGMQGSRDAEISQNGYLAQMKTRRSFPSAKETMLFYTWISRQPHVSHHDQNSGGREYEKLAGRTWSYPDSFSYPPDDDSFWRDGKPLNSPGYFSAGLSTD
jgi:hypothetical protein